ncbi:MAG: CPBP family intramembrane glutamic endopeptidase [Oscillospiraceae bacterium]|jgi:membrane protease YdiL (CAAX protease family)
MIIRTKHPVPTGLATKREKIAGWIYFPVHLLLMPILLSFLASVLPFSVSDAEINLIYMGAGFLYIMVFLRPFLRRDFDALLDGKLQVFYAVIQAIAIYWITAFVISIVWVSLVPESMLETLNPNDATLQSYTGRSGQIIKALGICIAPIVEEVLFRGVLFGQIRKANRILAYAVSALLFGIFHIWQYALVFWEPTLLLYAVQYVPHSIGLAWCYEHSNSIWVPIFYHMALNALAFFSL